MDRTKNVQCLKISEEMLELFCDIQYENRIHKIQKIYRELKDKINNIEDRWIKVDGEDYFIFTDIEDGKILIPDTRKMKRTYLPDELKANYISQILIKRNNIKEDIGEELQIKAAEKGAVLVSNFSTQILGLSAKGITWSIAVKVFQNKKCPMTNSINQVILDKGYTTNRVMVADKDEYFYCTSSGSGISIGSTFFCLQISFHQFEREETLFDIAEKYGIIPNCLSNKKKENLKELLLLYKDGVNVEDINSFKAYLVNSNRKELLGYSFEHDKIREEILSEKIDFHDNSDMVAFLKKYLNEYDFHRAKIQKYNSRWYLSDEGKGHWELWNESKADNSQSENKQESEKKENPPKEYVVHIKDGAIARNPLSDIKYNAVVGIDFGTKSTIVAVLDDNNNIIPLRVGMADYLEVPKREHYENPTVMQFADFNAFWQAYQSKSGRPYTSWEDLKISHEAFENMIAAKQSNEYAAFMSNLKQWAGGRYGKNEEGHIIIRDQKGTRFEINDYNSLTDEDIDPVELYAYYLGIFINNMHTGIYLDYLLSFPETFSLEIKEHLLSSFRKGIRRSLPECIFYDEEAAASFRVRQGPSEPAAYAACALEQYEIDPTDKGVFYGIFDFGGGTADFDYGIWKNAPEEEECYDYVIQHFGAGGDKNLGGENLLELLAYHIFSDNELKSLDSGNTNFQIMREKKIVFCRPPEGKLLPGTEALVSSEESAVLNTKQLMEILRLIWEEHEDFKKWQEQPVGGKKETVIECSSGTLTLHADSSFTVAVSLFDEEGKNKLSVQLQGDMKLVNEILNDRIEQGVRNFFEGLYSAYTKNKIESEEPIHIFLAGNSSRSERVAVLFQHYMQEYEKKMFSEKDYVIEEVETETIQEYEKETKHFMLFPPLGSQESIEIQRKMGVDIEEQDLMAPTGKTGVAFGMLMCRENSGIKVESEQKKTQQIKLNYYIGINSRRNFKMVFDRTTEYNKWYAFRKASDEMETFEFYYTELMEVLSGEIEIKNNPSIHRKKCMVDKSEEGAYIFFRFTAPSKLEYVVANKEGIDEGNYISSIYKVSL